MYKSLKKLAPKIMETSPENNNRILRSSDTDQKVPLLKTNKEAKMAPLLSTFKRLVRKDLKH